MSDKTSKLKVAIKRLQEEHCNDCTTIRKACESCITGVMIDAISGTIPVYNMNGRCDGCGEELHDDWKFCPYCGAPIHYQNDYWGKLNWKDLSK